jgi:serine/threonine protein kinase
MFVGGHVVSATDIDNESRAIRKLCERGACLNIVQVLRMGQLNNSPFFFIDMELCEMNLEDYLYRGSLGKPRVPLLVRDASSSTKSAQIWDTITQITRGVAFIHEQGEVHRDLKPQNGTP